MSAIPRLSTSSSNYLGQRIANDDFQQDWCSGKLPFSAIYRKVAQWNLPEHMWLRVERVNPRWASIDQCTTKIFGGDHLKVALSNDIPRYLGLTDTDVGTYYQTGTNILEPITEKELFVIPLCMRCIT
ncbi:hypothetical protein TNCV_970981 [Trichonephila clavipes]|nr:hypothetical protein TNCV_970981 [Trichonephila clavipes]